MILHKESTPTDFAKRSLFYYKNFYQLKIINEFSMNYSTASSYYLYYVIKGSSFITLEEKIFSLKKGDLLVVKKNSNIKFTSRDATVYIIEFDGKIAKDYIDEMNTQSEQGISVIDFTNIIMFFVRLKELTQYDSVNEVYISLNLEAILVEMYTKKFHSNKTDIPPQNYAILQALFYIEQNVGNKITLEELCEFVGYSVFHFSRLFKKEVGVSPYEYIIRFRMDLAKHLLITTNKSVKDISKQCGYANEINFFILFKKYESMSPKKFRLIKLMEEAK